ncbi:MAG: ATP-binding protein, partial [Planctomycetota bacterium]
VDRILTLPKLRGAGETENGIEFGESNSLIFKVSCVPVMAESPKGNGVLVGFENVTELESSKRAAKSANQAKSNFTANISHEKRTLKNAILGFTDWLRRGLASDPAEEQEYHSTIYSSGKHLRELINDVLDLSKIEADKMEISLGQFSPFSIIHDVENILRVRAEDKGIRLVTEYKNNFPELIYTDDVRLRQVVTNLVGNAIKFTSEGEVRIEAQMVLVDEIPMLRVSVIDSGIGMTEEQCRQIFDPFTPADSGVTRKFGGASLGLAICKKIVEALQGQIRVESELGQGSRFTFDVQVGEIFDVKWLNQEAYFESLKRQRSTHCNSITQLPPGRVLVVDDGLANRRLIRVILERAGCEVLEAVNGQEAVEIASAQQFDMVFMDMQMPILDGYKATVKLIENGLEAPVIALTANEIKGDQEKWQAAGCRGFIAKPVNIDILLATAAELLSSIPMGESKLEQAMERPWDQIEFRALFLEFMIPIQDCWENGDWEGLASSTSKLEQELVSFQKDLLAKVTGELNLICQGLMVCDPAEIVLTDVNNKMDDFLREAMAALISSKELSRARPEMPTLVVSEPVHRETASSEFELGPIVSELPADDVEFVEIIVEFSNTLNQKLKEMDQLLQDSDFEGLSRLAHWLKGAGGTCGYREFYEPAADLEKFARDQQSIEAENALCQLHQLKGRIQLPEIASH